MPFKVGHPYYPGSRKGRCGRKKSPLNVMRYLTEQIDDNWGELVEELIKQAMKGDREALMYCFDRRLGKPKATTEFEGGEALAAGMVLKIIQVVREHERLNSQKLLEESRDVGVIPKEVNYAIKQEENEGT